MRFERKYAPKSLDEVVYPSSTTERIIKSVADDLDRNIILYGNAGTGKSTCARLIPVEAIRRLESNQALSFNDAETLSYTGNQLNAEGMDNLQCALRLYPMSNLRKHVVLIDEADRMTGTSLANLKIAMEIDENAVWILCTNEVEKLSEPVRSRCKELNFAHFNNAGMIERAKFVLAAEGVSVPLPQIQSLVASARGDLRKLNQILQDVVES